MNVRDSDSSGSPSPEPKRQRIADIDWASAPTWQYEWWVGARVMAQFVGRGGPDTQFAGRWFPGEVTKVHENDTVDVEYDDGDEDEKLPRDRVRVCSARDLRAQNYKDQSLSLIHI